MTKKLDYWIVYVLTDPRDGSARYVGMTSRALHYRLSSHIIGARSGSVCKKKAAWHAELSGLGLRPEITELERFSTAAEAAEGESFFIRYLRAIGADLLNETLGGPGSLGRNFSHTEESRAKISAGNSGKPSGMLGKRHSEETRSKMRDAKVGVKRSEETVEKMRGRKLSEENRAKLLAARIGSVHSEESRSKMREAQLRRWAKLKSESEA